MALQFDRSLIGREFDRSEFPAVTPEAMAAYAVACGETNPLFVDEAAAAGGPNGTLMAPPTFVVSLRAADLLPKTLPTGARAGLDAGKDIEFGAPVRPGDVLRTSSTIHDVYEKTGRSGPMMFLVLRTTVTNQRHEMVAIIDQRMMFR